MRADGDPTGQVRQSGHSESGEGDPDLVALLPFCTPRQAECVQALIAHEGNAYKAAEALGCSRGTVRSAVKQARAKADKALRPLPPMHPKGHVLKGVSVKRDGDGNITGQWDKSKEAPDDPAAFEPVPPGHHVSKVSTFVVNGKPVAQWIQAPQDKIEQEAALHVALKKALSEYVRPVEPLAASVLYTDARTETHYMFGDPHIGMLAYAPETGEAFDLKIAEADLLGAMDRLVAGAAPSRVGVLCPLGDNFHADDDRQVTPAHGHKLSVDSRAPKVARVGINTVRRLIDRGLEKHQEMHVRIVPGNHDPVTSRWLALCLEMLYENEPRVTVFSNVNPVQMWEFGLNMFMLSHGDGFKLEQSAGIMAARAPEMWGRTRFRYSDQGHKHSDATIELPGVLARRHRTLAPKDDFASKFGYESGRDAKAYTFHELYGEIECKTVGIAWARVAA